MARLTLALPSGVLKVAELLGSAEGDVRIVGGAVRDSLAGLEVKDIDLATRLTPEAVMQRLRDAGLKVVPTGLAHGTVTVPLDTGPVEITTLRRDVETDGRRATIAFSDDWREDAARRDFTINALYAEPLSGEVYDYFDGVNDLRAGLVRFIGDPLTRIAEDHLRILRFFRFQARFGRSAPDPASLAACVARANDLMALSRERIADELLKLLALPDPGPVVALMHANRIFQPVLPEVVPAGISTMNNLISAEQASRLQPTALWRLAALLPPDQALAESVAARLRLSKAQRKLLTSIAARQPEDADNPRALAYWQGIDAAIARVLMAGGDISTFSGWTPPHFPMTGKAIIARGTAAGPEVARILQAVERQWVAEGFPDETRLNAIADALASA